MSDETIFLAAATIKQQITFNSWLAVSAREASYGTTVQGNPALSFRYGKKSPARRVVQIELTPADVYTVHVFYTTTRGRNAYIQEEVATYTDVYAEDLAELIRSINQDHGGW